MIRKCKANSHKLQRFYGIKSQGYSLKLFKIVLKFYEAGSSMLQILLPLSS